MFFISCTLESSTEYKFSHCQIVKYWLQYGSYLLQDRQGLQSVITNQFTGIINPNSIVDVWYMLKSESID